MAIFRRRKSLVPGEPRRGYESTVTPPSWLALYEDGASDLAAVYENSPALQSVIGVIANNAAEMPVRVRELPGRAELGQRDPLVQLLARPNPQADGYRFRQQVYGDLCLSNNFVAIMVDGDEMSSEFTGPPPRAVGALVRVPPGRWAIVTADDTETHQYEVQFSGGSKRFSPEEILHVHGWHPSDSRMGMSKVLALRGVLGEERSLIEYRGRFWRNSARQAGVIERPIEAPEWSDEAFERFRGAWKELHSGKDASGVTAVLEEGMKLRPTAFSPRDSEITSSLEQVVQLVAHTFNVPFGLVGGGSQRNLQQNRRSLFQDAILPLTALVDSALTSQLVPRVKGDAGSNVIIDRKSVV